jgi:hypothetical protein
MNNFTFCAGVVVIILNIIFNAHLTDKRDSKTQDSIIELIENQHVIMKKLGIN